jgi:PIN domain nuclease of toxin-antitoxin system
LREDESTAGTHVFLWFITGNNRLSQKFLDSIRDTNNQVYLSVVSVWEAVIKYHLGKLPLPHPPESYLPRQRSLHQVVSLPLDEASVTRLANLPPLHRDPFDRILISQAIEHNLTMVTVDPAILDYSVATLAIL